MKNALNTYPAILLLLITVFPVSADKGETLVYENKRVKDKKVFVHYKQRYYPNAELKAFIQSLKRAIKEKDEAHVLSKIAKGFYFSRDFGGMISPTMNHLQVFENIFTLDSSKLAPEYNNYGWGSLLSMLYSEKFQYIEGDVCGPAEADLKSEKDNDYIDYFSDGYIDGNRVNIRALPSMKAKVLEQSSYQLLYRIDEIKNDEGQRWVKVILANHEVGYVLTNYFSSFLKPKLCFSQENGEWMMSGYIGGGD